METARLNITKQRGKYNSRSLLSPHVQRKGFYLLWSEGADQVLEL